jgi:hypothetical protein
MPDAIRQEQKSEDRDQHSPHLRILPLKRNIRNCPKNRHPRAAPIPSITRLQRNPFPGQDHPQDAPAKSRASDIGEIAAWSICVGFLISPFLLWPARKRGRKAPL